MKTRLTESLTCYDKHDLFMIILNTVREYAKQTIVLPYKSLHHLQINWRARGRCDLNWINYETRSTRSRAPAGNANEQGKIARIYDIFAAIPYNTRLISIPSSINHRTRLPRVWIADSEFMRHNTYTGVVELSTPSISRRWELNGIGTSRNKIFKQYLQEISVLFNNS